MCFKGSEQRGCSDAPCYYAHRLRVQKLDYARNAFTVTVPKLDDPSGDYNGSPRILAFGLNLSALSWPLSTPFDSHRNWLPKLRLLLSGHTIYQKLHLVLCFSQILCLSLVMA